MYNSSLATWRDWNHQEISLGPAEYWTLEPHTTPMHVTDRWTLLTEPSGLRQKLKSEWDLLCHEGNLRTTDFEGRKGNEPGTCYHICRMFLMSWNTNIFCAHLFAGNRTCLKLLRNLALSRYSHLVQFMMLSKVYIKVCCCYRDICGCCCQQKIALAIVSLVRVSGTRKIDRIHCGALVLRLVCC